MLKYTDLTQSQKDSLTNGCGSKGGWFKPPNFIFTASCNQHDFYYWRGGVEADRLIADDKFYEFMKQDAKSCGNLLIKAVHLFIAWFYYRMVRHFGKDSFSYGKMKTKADLLKITKDS